MTKNFSVFPKAGEEIANLSVFQQYQDQAIAGYAVLTGLVGSRTSASRIDFTSGTYSNGGIVKLSSLLPYLYVGSIPAAASGKHRYDLIYIDGTDNVLKREAGSEDYPADSGRFLENYVPEPPQLADTDWIILTVICITDTGIAEGDFGTYATAGVCNLKNSSAMAADDVTVTVDVNGVLSVKSIPIQAHKASHTTGSDIIDIATTSVPGLESAADKTKLNGIAAGADVTGSNPPQAHKASHTTGSDIIDAATTSVPGLESAADKTKLDGIATGADVTLSSLASAIHAATEKVTPVDADEFGIRDSGGLKKVTFTNLRTTLNLTGATIVTTSGTNTGTGTWQIVDHGCGGLPKTATVTYLASGGVPASYYVSADKICISATLNIPYEWACLRW